MDKSRSKAELSRERKDKRSRSRSPKHSHSRPSSSPSRDRKRSHHYRDERRRSRSRSSSSSDSDDYSRRRHARKSSPDFKQKPSATPPPKISMSLAKDKPSGGVAASFKRPAAGISLKLSAPQAKSAQPKLTVHDAFNNDSDEEVEEMPAECKMRMKNIGRMTPTSSGPNSFGKTKLGFVDTKKMHEKKLQEMMNQFGD